MPGITQVQDAIYDWLEQICAPTPVDWEDQDDADRKGGRVSIRLQEDVAAHHSPTTASGDAEAITERALLTLVINTRGQNADFLSKKIRASVWATRRFGPEGLWGTVGLASVSSINNLSALESAQIGPRYELRVKLHTVLTYNFGADYAETVDITVAESKKGIVLETALGGDPYPTPEDC